MNFHTDIYKSITKDRLARLKKETYENHRIYKDTDSTKWNMKKELYPIRVLQRWKAR
ncbi:hypothetical protein [Virgibacillus kimchii]